MDTKFVIREKALRDLFELIGRDVSGIALERTEKTVFYSVSIISNEDEFNTDTKTLKSKFQKLLLVTGLKFNHISQLSFLINDKMNYRIQFKFTSI